MNNKFVFQIISHETGARSEPFVATWDQMHDLIQQNEERDNDDLILLVAIVDPEDSEGMTIPKTPLIKIETFVNMRSTTEEAANA